MNFDSIPTLTPDLHSIQVLDQQNLSLVHLWQIFEKRSFLAPKVAIFSVCSIGPYNAYSNLRSYRWLTLVHTSNLAVRYQGSAITDAPSYGMVAGSKIRPVSSLFFSTIEDNSRFHTKP